MKATKITVIIKILELLSNNQDGLRYYILKSNLDNISDSTFSSCLRSLQGHGCIKIEAKSNQKGRNYVVYCITEKGEKLVQYLEIPLFLKKINDLEEIL